MIGSSDLYSVLRFFIVSVVLLNGFDLSFLWNCLLNIYSIHSYGSGYGLLVSNGDLLFLLLDNMNNQFYIETCFIATE